MTLKRWLLMGITLPLLTLVTTLGAQEEPAVPDPTPAAPAAEAAPEAPAPDEPVPAEPAPDDPVPAVPAPEPAPADEAPTPKPAAEDDPTPAPEPAPPADDTPPPEPAPPATVEDPAQEEPVTRPAPVEVEEEVPPVPTEVAPVRTVVITPAQIASLLRRVQDEVELDPTLNGVLLHDAFIVTDPEWPGPHLRIRGKLVAEDQRPVVEKLIAELARLDPAWRPIRQDVTLELEELRILPVSPRLASVYYAMGLNAFWDGDYVLADRAFTRAISESPDSDTLKYWRVMTAIAMGQLDRAEQKVSPLLRKNPRGSHAPLIANELERVQGCYRWTLVDLEQKVLLSQVP